MPDNNNQNIVDHVYADNMVLGEIKIDNIGDNQMTVISDNLFHNNINCLNVQQRNLFKIVTETIEKLT